MEGTGRSGQKGQAGGKTEEEREGKASQEGEEAAFKRKGAKRNT